MLRLACARVAAAGGATCVLGAPAYTAVLRGGGAWAARAASSSSTVDPAEAAKFGADAELWWEERHGPFAPLHRMNPTRCRFIRAVLCRHFGRDPTAPQPLMGLSLLDVGCGGGILTEPLARMGAHVTGVDAAARSVAVARAHAALDPAVAARTAYEATSAEALLAQRGAAFDAVLSLEVIEHVADVELFVATLAGLVRPGGAAVVSTLNRTTRAAALAVAAERVLGWVPPGTHDWRRFLRPEELAGALARSGLQLEELAGMVYDPLRRSWALSADDVSINYICYARKGDHAAAAEGGGGGAHAAAGA